MPYTAKPEASKESRDIIRSFGVGLIREDVLRY